MTERGLPSADASPACPFVAFEDDRDERADRPDHRHRCYAEEPPAPRAAAHQEAYCLSSAFPVCPVFQRWARREAAHARADGGTDTSSRSAAGPAGAGGPASEWTTATSPSAPRPAEPAPQRNPPREWSAPPPWAAGAGGAGRGRRDDEGDDAGHAPGFLPPRYEVQGLAGSAADRLAAGDAPSTPTSSGTTRPADIPAPTSAPIPAPRPPAGDARSSGPDPELASLVGPAALSRSAEDRLAAMRAAEREADEADYAEATGDYPQGRLGRRPSVSSTRHHDPGDRDRPPARRERVQGNAPSWEKARRSESFPMLKGRGDLPGLPGLPRVWVLFGALVIAAVALFFLPQLLDVGGQGGEDPTPTPATSSAAATPTPEPTPEPEPTPQLYVIKQGDTLSKVAAEFGVTLEELLAANVDRIEDPDRISIGDEIIIPTEPPEEVEGGGASAAPSP